MKNLVCTVSSALLFTVVLNAQQKADFSWLPGNWKINAGNTVIVEQWYKINDSTFHGKSYLIKNNKDTIPQENVKLVYRNSEWYYIPTVADQNNNQPVTFKIIFLKGTEFIAENPAHDFPQRIAYRRIKNQLFASIEGRNNNKFSKINYDFVTE